MTVRELFECFSAYFDKIIYFDETNNIEDSINLCDCNNEVKVTEYDNFVNVYADYGVADWCFDNKNNTISISIKL